VIDQVTTGQFRQVFGQGSVKAGEGVSSINARNLELQAFLRPPQLSWQGAKSLWAKGSGG